MVRKWLLAVVLLLSWCASSLGLTVPQPVVKHWGTVVRVRVGSSLGSGVYIGNKYILTCAHLFDGEGTQSATITFIDDQQLRGQAVQIARSYDQSLIRMEADPAGIAPAPLASEEVKVGDVVIAAGYDADASTIKWRPGKCVGFMSPGNGEKVWFELDNQVYGGSSGGPIFNEKGEVIGNLWGASPGRTVGLTCLRTLRFLNPFRREINVYNINCPPRGGSVGGGAGPDGRPTYETPRGPVAPPPSEPPSAGDVPAPAPDCGQGQDCDRWCNKCREEMKKYTDEQIKAMQDRLAKCDEIQGKVDKALADNAQLLADIGRRTDDAVAALGRMDAVNDRVSALEQQVAGSVTFQQQIISRLDQLSPTPAPEVDLTPVLERLAKLEQELKAEAGKPKADDVILYYTSRNAQGVQKVDNRIAQLKKQGYPIVVTTLSEKDAEVQGVPRIFIPAKNRSVIGITNCEVFLSNLLPR